jgi:hypothetical protein
MSNKDTSRLEALRVAQAELSGGDTSLRVYTQASPGAAMFLTDRPAVKEKLASEIRQIVLGEESSVETKTR